MRAALTYTVAATASIVALAGCGAGASGAIASSDPPATVYVADVYKEKVFEYPAGVANPSPKAEFVLPAAPAGLAESSSGQIYVALPSERRVDIFAARGALVGQLTRQNGICIPYGVTFDSAGDLYVAQDGDPASACEGPAVVVEFSPSGATPSYTYVTSQYVPPGGVATDAQGSVYVWVFEGIVDIFPRRSQHYREVQPGTAECTGGVAILPNKELVAAFLEQSETFAPPAYREVGSTSYAPYDAGTYITTASDGTLYVPTNRGTVRPMYGAVWVYPASGASAPYRITARLKEPVSVAAGP